jgi:hypothetical protein
MPELLLHASVEHVFFDFFQAGRRANLKDGNSGNFFWNQKHRGMQSFPMWISRGIERLFVFQL